jgi:adenosylmethionine-8-amino-7-oxononanoate aminotransferase
VTPDLQTIAKGLGGGYAAIGGLLISQRVVDVLTNGSGAFVHGHTYQAHPVACAAALEVQRIIREEQLVPRVRQMGLYLEKCLRERLASHPNVGDIRGRGLFMAVEFVQDRASRKPFDARLQIAERVKEAGFSFGVAVYPASGTRDGSQGDHVLVSPPFTVSTAEIDMVVDRLGKAVDAALAQIA